MNGQLAAAYYNLADDCLKLQMWKKRAPMMRWII